MAIVTLDKEVFKSLTKFEVKCKSCNSQNIELEIDWASYPSCEWNNVTLICKDCKEAEICYES